MAKKKKDDKDKTSREQVDKDRRNLVLTGSIAALTLAFQLPQSLSALFSLLRGKNSICAVPDLKYPPVDAANMDLLRTIVSIDDDPIKFYAGKTNILRKAGGKEGLSSYLTNASSAFLSFIKKGTGYKVEQCDPNSEVLQYDATENFLMLGGPVANQEAARFADYTYLTVLDKPTGKEVLLPLFDLSKGRYRWGFFCGDTGYGFYKGEPLKAKRYEDGELVERSLYGIIDTQKHGSTPILYEKGLDGFLQEEALVIIKRPNPKHPDRKSIAVIGGVHGYSTEAFARDLNDNLKKLQNVISNDSYYQAYIPVTLEHNHLDKITIGRLDWRRVEKHRLRLL